MEDEILSSFLSLGDEYRILFSRLGNRTAVHAYLISGEKGVGKKTLAGYMASALLCKSGNRRPCGVCRNCILCKNGEHPDLILIRKGIPIAPGVKKDRTTIPVEDIREMIRLCGVQSSDGNIHVVLLFDADKMTPQAQNCLLKTLEEPPPDTYIILVTDHPETLLATVKSRCRQHRVKPWTEEYICHTLVHGGTEQNRAREAASLSNGSIGSAMELSSDDTYWNLREEVLNSFFRVTRRSEALKISALWKDRKAEAEQVFGILESFIGILSESRFSCDSHTDLSLFPPQWIRFSALAEPERFVFLVETVSAARRQVQFSVNFQAIIERIIFVFMGEGNSWLQ